MRHIATAPESSAITPATPQSPILQDVPLQAAAAPTTIDKEHEESRIPVVRLDVQSISDTLAARLAATLTAMVLFLKNQIPLPIPQMARMSGKNSSPKAAKQRAELLNAYDTLGSHLTTTFAALSSALAGCQGESGNSTEMDNRLAYIAILLGPSLGTAKSKVFLGVDHFEARVWGQPQCAGNENYRDGTGTKCEDKENNVEEQSDDEDLAESDSEGGPSDSDSENDEDADEEDSCASEDEAPTQAEQNRAIARTPAPPPVVSYADEQRFLQNAERLLSRTLAGADAEGHGLASDMSPTQTHIMIRAPRNFSHPAWIPRQNITSSLNGSLEAFLKESRAGPALAIRKTPPKKQKPEGVWLTTQAEFVPPEPSEDEEMIWWSWDGKLVGFSDW